MRRPGRGAVLLLLFAAGSQAFAADGTGQVTRVNERLAELGHPDTRTCRIESNRGLGELTVFQYPARGSAEADQEQAISMLNLLAPALTEAGMRYFGFHPRRRHGTCLSGSPEYVFWRDYADDWRSVDGHPARYLGEIRKRLPQELQGTPAEAYVIWSLGLVEQRRGRIRRSVELFEEAYALLEGSGDPNDVVAFVLVPLIHHHLGGDGDEDKGQRYLDAYARVAESTSSDGEYLPMIKVPPVYPANAFRRRQEGHVLLEFTVDEKGRVVNPIVIEEEPQGVFGESAREAARSFRYLPRIVDGVAVPTPGVRNLVTFEIE